MTRHSAQAMPKIAGSTIVGEAQAGRWGYPVMASRVKSIWMKMNF
jgi:hypothetical protein